MFQRDVTNDQTGIPWQFQYRVLPVAKLVANFGLVGGSPKILTTFATYKARLHSASNRDQVFDTEAVFVNARADVESIADRDRRCKD